MKKFNIHPTIFTTESIIDRFAALGKHEETQYIIDRVKDSILENTLFDIRGYALLIQLYSKYGNIHQAETILDLMKKNNVELNTRIYNSLMEYHSKNGNSRQMLKLLAQMKENRTKPDINTFRVLVSFYAKNSDFKKVENLLSQMEEIQIFPNVHFFNSLINDYPVVIGYRQLIHINAIRQKYKNVFILNLRTYESLFFFYRHNKDYAEMKKLFDEMQELRIRPNIKILNIMLQTFIKQNLIPEINHVLSLMKKHNIRPNLQTLQSLLNLHHRFGNVEQANYIVQQIRNNFQLTTQAVNQLISFYGRKGDFEEVKNIISEMKKLNLEPTENTFDQLIQLKVTNEVMPPETVEPNKVDDSGVTL